MSPGGEELVDASTVQLIAAGSLRQANPGHGLLATSRRDLGHLFPPLLPANRRLLGRGLPRWGLDPGRGRARGAFGRCGLGSGPLALLVLAAAAFAVPSTVVRLASERLAAERLVPGAAWAGLAADRFAGAFGWGPVVATGCGFGRPLHDG